jgi:hypothetical protein
MRKMLIALTIGVIAIPSAGIVACSSVEVEMAGASVYGTKGGPFCAADDSIDRDTVNVDSEAGFVKALKAHKHQIDTMKANLPSGSVGKDAKKLVNIAESVIAGGNPNQFFAAAGESSGAIDTYCGVQGNGQPLPGYYNKGAKTAFCKTFLPVFEAASNAPSDAATLAAVTAHQTDLNELASELSTLPKSIKAQASEAVDTAQSAIASKSAAPLTSESNKSAADVALYCGQNE